MSDRAKKIVAAAAVSAADVPARPDDPAEPTLSETLTEVRKALTRYVVFPSEEAADAVTLFAAATHVQHQLQFAARLNIRSPVKRCGKSRLFDLLALLVHAALVTVNISAAALVHGISEDDPPTIMLDEADATFSKALKGDEKTEHLRGILNSGFDRGRPYTRYDITRRQNEDCPTFAMAVIAGIGAMPDTIEDRSIIIMLQRKSGHEKVSKYRLRRDKPAVQALGEQLHDVIAPYASKIADAEPEMPSGLNDRAEDVWEALIAVADHAGDDWPARARKAAQILCAAAEDDAADSMRLLADLRGIYGQASFLYSATIVGKLAGIEGAPWSEWTWSRGERAPITQRGLAALLAEYQVRPRDGREGGTGPQRKGYYAENLADLWERYVPERGVRDIRDTGDNAGQERRSPADSPVADDVADGSGDPRQAEPVADVADVADTRQTEQRRGDVADVADAVRASATADPTSDQRQQPGVADVADVADTSRTRDHAAGPVDAVAVLLERELGAVLIETTANGYPRRARPGFCEACGMDEDSIMHAVNCLGQEP